MTNELIFKGEGIYIPQVGEGIVLWRKDETGDPLVGVNVHSIAHGRMFANVFVIEGDELKWYAARKEGK